MKIDVYKLQRAVGPQIGIEFLWGGGGVKMQDVAQAFEMSVCDRRCACVSVFMGDGM